jgi:hypothetical protein
MIVAFRDEQVVLPYCTLRGEKMRRSISAVYVMQIAITAFLGLLLMMPQAFAQDRPCAEDMAQYCSGITPGGGRPWQVTDCCLMIWSLTRWQ